ncbi:MAG: C45 family autoproteolytic acyltransferase/hydrolase [Methanobacteriota archaeon]
MKKPILAILLCIFLCLPSAIAISHEKNAQPLSSDALHNATQYENGYRYNIQGWVYVHIEGDPYERGLQHGYLLAGEIIDIITRWSNTIHNRELLSLLTPYLSETRYDKISETWWNYCTKECTRLYANKIPEEYQQEMQGIADGVNKTGKNLFNRNITYNDILALNVMYEFLSKLERKIERIHPLRTFLYYLQPINTDSSSTDMKALSTAGNLELFTHHCNGFIATGNATTDGQVVISNSMYCGPGSWWWTYYICLRWNIILDIQPTTGHRIQMTASPGFIWSDHDFYQNDAGIVLLETTVPQGMYDDIGLPLAVRARTAMQYADSIDDVIYYLRHRNDGAMNAVWLIGDTKTGEIARLDLGYRRYSVQRTFNGFYWSANNPEDLGVRLEKVEWKKLISRLLSHLLFNTSGFGYHSIFYRPESRDLKYEELGNYYYGDIDVDVVKTIMATPPIVQWSTDCKITDTSLVAQKGMWLFWGNPGGKILNISNVNNPTPIIEQIPPTGWVRFYSLPPKENYTLPTTKQSLGSTPTIQWEYNTGDTRNDFTSQGIIHNNTLYLSISSNAFIAVDKTNGTLRWKRSLGSNPTTPIMYQDIIYVGSSAGISGFNRNGTLVWSLANISVVSGPLITNNLLIFGDKNRNVYAYNISTKTKIWQIHYPAETQFYIINDIIYLASNTTIYALYATNHTTIWSYQTKGPLTSPPLYNDDIVYFGSWDTRVYALNVSTGELLWSFETGWGIDTSPAIIGSTLIVGSEDNHIYALNKKNGTQEWIFPMNAGIHSVPGVLNETVFFASDDGCLYATNLSSGENRWVFSPQFTIDNITQNYQTTPIRSNILSDDGILYVAISGILYAIQI